MKLGPVALAALACMPASVNAQAKVCAIPSATNPPRSETQPPDKINVVAATGNLLALSWSPQFCRAHKGDPKHVTQCGGTNRFGFILHGLWPDGPGRNDPAWCKPVAVLPAPLIRQNFCMMPSPQLQQHEWAKHGTCMSDRPEHYFKAASILFNAVKWPDMDAISGERPTVGQFAARFAQINPGLKPDMILVQADRGGWLQEVRICLTRDYRPQRCPRGERTAPSRIALKIWRDER